jgi:hypothetical protein
MSDYSDIEPPERWRECAQEMLDRAAAMSDPEMKCIMLTLAADYQRLAERAERLILDAQQRPMRH